MKLLAASDLSRNVPLVSIVRTGAAATQRAEPARVPALVQRPEHARFIVLAHAEITHLHAGNAVRFGLRLLGFQAWQDKR